MASIADLIEHAFATGDIDPFLKSFEAKLRRAQQASVRRRLTWEEVSNSPEWEVFDEKDGGQIAYRRGTEGHKAAVRERKQREDAQAHDMWIAENPVQAAFEDLAYRFPKSVTRIELRKGLDAVCGFTPERLAELVELMEDEGIEVK